MTKTFHTEQSAVGGPDVNSKQGLDAPREKHTPLKSELTPEVDSKVHYGHAHARTEQLYQERRAQYEMKKQLEAAEASSKQAAEPSATEASVEASAPETFGREQIREMALDAVKSVIGAAREAVQGHPLVGARKLAGDAVSGALRVTRGVAARAAQMDKRH
ncbi:MAG: hypothetical protein ABW123_20715 [Cystobacter sp.]